MKLRDLVKETFNALDANRVRSILTILGIVIGISAVIAMTSLIDGLRVSMVKDLGLTQARMVTISAYANRDIVADDLQQIKLNVSGYQLLTGYSTTSDKVTTGTKSEEVQITGVTEDYFTIMGLKPLQGKITAMSNKAHDHDIVIDKSVSNKLFKTTKSVGNTVTIGNDSYNVVAVMDNSTTMGQNIVYLPFSTVSSRMIGSQRYDEIIGLAKSGTDMQKIAKSTTKFLRKYLGIKKSDQSQYVYVSTMDTAIKQFESTISGFRIIMTVVASISLLVGGIGIMNMMLTNVTERIHEIGLRKALGARSADITTQFLFESVVLCVIGGIVGIALGYAGAWGLSGMASGAMGASSTITPVFSPTAVAAVTGICVGIGIIFGYYPARRAAKMNPVEALRYQ